MKKVLLGIVGGGFVIIAGLVAFVSMQPSQTTIERDILIAAEPGDLWPYLADQVLVDEWSPWNEKDPDLEQTFSDPSTGVGAFYTWSGNEDVGSGRAEVASIDEGVSVSTALEFLTPYPGTAVSTASVAATEGGSTVTWTMVMDNDFMSKAAGLFMDMDAMLGPEFEKGLALLEPLGVAAAAARVEAERVEADRIAQEAAEAEAAAEGDAAEE